MNSLRKWLYKPRKEDTALLAQFYYVEEELTDVLNELDSFDGRKEPERCQQLVTRLRACQDKALSLITKMIHEALPVAEQAARDFRAKFPDDVLHENLAGQLWFGAECLAAGSNILNRESESSSMRPLAKAVTRQLDTLRVVLREQSLTNPRSYSEKVKDALRVFDNMFAEFEISYVSAMVPVKSIKEYEQHQDVTVLFSETLQRGLKVKLVDQDQLDMCDPALMFTIPRLVIVYGLLLQPETPVLCCNDSTLMPPMFKHFTRLLRKIRDLLVTLSYRELYWLEMCLARAHDPNEQEFSTLPKNPLYESWQQNDVAGTQAQRQMADIEEIFASNTELKQLIDDISAYIQYSSQKYGTRKRRHIDMRLVRKVRAKQIKYNKVEPKSSEDEETAVLEQACEIGGRLSSRNHFKSTLDLIQRLYVCISGVADQLHHNFPADLRAILKTVFLLHQSKDEDEEDEDSEPDAEVEHDEDSEETRYTPSASVRPPPQRRKVLSAADATSTAASAASAEARAHAGSIDSHGVAAAAAAVQDDHYQTLSSMRSGGPTPTTSASTTTMITSYSAPLLHAISGGVEVPPAWVPDEYAVACYGCGALFTFVRRRHHCRNCGQIYCSGCCSNFIPLPKFGYGERPVRVCCGCRASTEVSAGQTTTAGGVAGSVTAGGVMQQVARVLTESAGSVSRTLHRTASGNNQHNVPPATGRVSPVGRLHQHAAVTSVSAVPLPVVSAVVSGFDSADGSSNTKPVLRAARMRASTNSDKLLHETATVVDDDMSPLTIAPPPRGPCASTAFSSSTPIPPIMEDTNMALAQATIQQDAAVQAAAEAAAENASNENLESGQSAEIVPSSSSIGSRRRPSPPTLVINTSSGRKEHRNDASTMSERSPPRPMPPSTPRLPTTSVEHIETLNHLLSPSSSSTLGFPSTYSNDDFTASSSSTSFLRSPYSSNTALNYDDSDLSPMSAEPTDRQSYRPSVAAAVSPLVANSGATSSSYVGRRPSWSSNVADDKARLVSGGASDNDLDFMFQDKTLHHMPSLIAGENGSAETHAV